MPDKPLRILAIGAHPDDCEVKCAGTAAKWSAAGHVVRFVSATDGQTGHHEQGGAVLAQRRMAEAKAAADVIGIESQVLAIPNGQIEPSLAYRAVFIGLIREFAPDLVLTHRPNDYHPDHRYTSVLVQDAAYMVTVPPICADTPHLRDNPVFGYLSDSFRKPVAFQPEVVVDVDSVMDLKWDLLDAHSSQFYEWLPYNEKILDQVPSSPDGRRRWLEERWSSWLERVANDHRGRLLEIYGEEHGRGVRFAEAFEISEYGTAPSPADLPRLFPISSAG